MSELLPMVMASPYLMNLAPHLHKAIASAFQYQMVPAGAALVKEGVRSDGFYLVLSGSAACYQHKRVEANMGA
eukprot:5686013-Pyramimonas_sp.AAC.1